MNYRQVLIDTGAIVPRHLVKKAPTKPVPYSARVLRLTAVDKTWAQKHMEEYRADPNNFHDQQFAPVPPPDYVF